MSNSDSNNKSQCNPEEAGNSCFINMAGSFFADPVVSCRVEGDDGAILFNPDTDSTILINRSGLTIWNFIQKPRTINEIYAYMLKEFTECPDESAIHNDIVTFISDLSPDYIREE